MQASRPVRATALIALMILAEVAWLGCQSSGEPFAEAVIIKSLNQSIGGPTANARVDDFLLRNDQMRVVIEQGSLSYHPADVGGSIIDIDLERPERQFRSGRGLDQLGQIAPIANLSMAQATTSAHVRITGSRNGAEVTTAVKADPIYRILVALTLLLEQRFVDTAEFRMYNEYELRPGERILRVTTTVGFDVPFCRAEEGDACNEECDDVLYDDDCECEAIPARCMAGVRVIDADPLPDRPSASILDIVLGDLPRPLGSGSCTTDEECDVAGGQRCVDVTSNVGGEYRVCRGPDDRDSGVFLGDLLIFGGHLEPFLRGVGYDTETDIRRLYDRGEDTLATPLDIDGVFATGDRISYGYASPDGRILAPLFRGPFSMGATHAASCPSSQPGCLSNVLVRFERWVSVGEGDVASAQEPILRALGKPLGTIRGFVTRTPSGDPVSRASVYALANPQFLGCDEACQADPACALPEGEPDTWSVEELIQANRCRTRQGVFSEGTAAVETLALTDPGTDQALDGDYRMAVPPGTYVLVAQDSYRARSRLVPVAVEAGKSVTVPLALPEAGVLEYAIFDETGRPSPGKVTIGTCLPRNACTGDDDCEDGELCQAGTCACPWQTFVPLELGGNRPNDGVLTVEQTATGWGRVELPPGDYELLFSRGPHYSIERQLVTIEPRVAVRAEASLRRVVDRVGWASASFHVHTANSMDSGTPVDHRMVGSVAEEMDFMSSSDHDWITRYDSTIEELGLSHMLNSQVGLEVTTQEYGHYLAFPIDYQAWSGGERLPSNNTVQWRGLAPQSIIDEARLRALPDLPVVIDIPHPYDYFEFYRLDPVTLEPTSSLLSTINFMLDPALFTGDFEALELVNSKTYSRIRRPTLDEVRFYSQGLDELIASFRSGAIDRSSYERRVFELSMESIRQRLHRTYEEQEAFLAGEGADVDCSCGGDGDCAAGLVCDQATLSCVTPPVSGGEPPPGTGLCRKYRGVIDDWFNMLNRGVVRTGVGGSDEHGKETGMMRTFLRTKATTAPYLTQSDVIAAVLGGQAIVSNGPMVHFSLDAAQVGDMLRVSPGQSVTLSIRVEKAHWYDVDRIEVYRNGKLIHWVQGCESTRGQPDPHGHACMPTGNDVVVAWDADIEDQPTEDSWYVVLAYGLDGRPLSPVYGSEVLASLGTPEITQRIYDIIPVLREFRNPRYPSLHPVLPFAFTNPIWVDVNGDGWNPPWTPPSWCRPGSDFGC